MKTIKFINDNDGVGDFLCTVPFMLDYLKTNEATGKLHGNFNRWAFEGLATTSKTILSSVDVASDEIKVLCSDALAHHNKTGGHLHMAQCYYDMNGLAVPPLPLMIDIEPVKVNSVDVVFCPFSSSGRDAKTWPLDRWRLLKELLGAQTICAIASSKCGGDDIKTLSDMGFDMVVDQPCSLVASLLKTTRLLVTVETGIGHLAQFLGLKNVVMLDPAYPHWKFANYPAARTIRKSVGDITVDEVLAGCEARLLEKWPT
jgi:hypothetical protein